MSQENDSQDPLPPESASAGEFKLLLKALAKYDGSDLHIKVGAPPVVRVKGDCRGLDSPPLNAGKVQEILYEILSEEQLQDLRTNGAVDLAVATEFGRFRVNAYRERGNIALAVRRVRSQIPRFEELLLPIDSMEKILSLEEGLVIVCGATGSGKTTTLAAVLEQCNQRRRCHISTIEDPIEFTFTDKRSIVTQREVGLDVPSFKAALRSAVRQDPDIILIGEMRDGETFEAALQASETGHLVFTTLHANTAPQSILRILELFPEARHNQIRLALYFNLRAVLCQKLLPSIKPGVSRVPATEAMFTIPIIREFIRKGEDHKLPDILRTGREKGMHDFNISLHKLIQLGLISEQMGLESSPAPEALTMRLQGISLDEARSGITG